MNKQELIEQIKGLKNLFGNKEEYIEIDTAIKLIEQLDEPQKPAVPQFVADWYEDIVDEFYIVLERLILNYKNNTDMPICKWFFETEDALTILINMHQFGYTVEKEKRYYVRFKFIEDSYSYLTLINHLHAWTLTDIKLDKKFRNEHTRKQLEKAGFDWVFDCPGIEIEEVKG